MCGSSPCVACRGRPRRERERALYRANQLRSSLPAVNSVATVDVLTRPGTESLHAAIDACAAAYTTYIDSGEGWPAARDFESAVRDVGVHVLTAADGEAEQRILTDGCSRPIVSDRALESARNELRSARNDWSRLHARVRATHRLPISEPVADELLFDKKLPAVERRWRHGVKHAYLQASTAFLELSATRSGQDAGWVHRQQIRADCYLDILSECRALGMPGHPDAAADHFPTAWLSAIAAAEPEAGTERCGVQSGHHRLVHQVEDAVPAVHAANLIHAQRTSSDGVGGIAVHALVGRGVDGRAEPLAVGAEALFTGRFGGLVGDGYRTRNDHHRALVLGAWAAL